MLPQCVSVCVSQVPMKCAARRSSSRLNVHLEGREGRRLTVPSLFVVKVLTHLLEYAAADGLEADGGDGAHRRRLRPLGGRRQHPADGGRTARSTPTHIHLQTVPGHQLHHQTRHGCTHITRTPHHTEAASRQLVSAAAEGGRAEREGGRGQHRRFFQDCCAVRGRKAGRGRWCRAVSDGWAPAWAPRPETWQEGH